MCTSFFYLFNCFNLFVVVSRREIIFDLDQIPFSISFRSDWRRISRKVDKNETHGFSSSFSLFF